MKPVPRLLTSSPGEPELAGELVEERQLINQDFSSRGREIEIRDAVDLGKHLAATGLWRPFEIERDAGERREIEVRLEREGVDDLAALLAHRRKRGERTVCDKPGLLGELAQRGREQLGTGLDEAFGDRPGAIILACPVRTARMREQNFERWPPPKGEKARADFAL